MPRREGELSEDYRARLAAKRDTPHHLSKNQLRYFDLIEKNPYITQKHAAELLGLSHHTVRSWFWGDKNFKTYYDLFILDQWNDLVKGAVSNVLTLIEECDWPATKYVLDNKGYGATKKIDATVDATIDAVVVNVNIEDEEDGTD